MDGKHRILVDMSDVDGGSAVPKVEPYEEDEFSDSDQEPEDPSNTQEPAQVQKRKGGRKPVRDAISTGIQWPD